jgi:hypothetical protein
MGNVRFGGIGLAILAFGSAGLVQAQEIKIANVVGIDGTDAARVTFGSNFVVDPCSDCKYNATPSGYAVWGPDNCTSPGDVQSVAVPFIAAASGIPERISTSIVLNDPADCPTNTVTLGLYADTCGSGPGTLLAQTDATVTNAACGLTVAKLTGAPALSQGVKYWIAATTTAAQTGLDSRWHASNTAGYSFNSGAGWQAGSGITPAFAVRGSVTFLGGTMSNAQDRSFGGNLFVDPCTGCDYDSNAGGFDVRGPDNCTLPGQTHWEAVPFVANRTGVPKRISAALVLHNPTLCPYNKVTLSLYTDNACQGTPGTPFVSGEASVPSAPCDLAVASLRNSPSLTKGVKYWVVATTTAAQTHLDAGWHPSNNAQLAADLGIGWLQFSSGTPAFLVQ